MATITTDIHLDADPAAAWDAVRDFGAVHERVAAGFVVASRTEGRDRVIRFANGAEARERLVTLDDDRWRLVYSVVESSLGLRHHQASVEVLDAEGGGTRFVWTTDVLPDDVAPTIEAMMAQGATAIAGTIPALNEGLAVDVQLTIGEFSKMTYLSVKALRHYHDVGLLEPAAVDPMTGYRRYAASQVGTAQAIRRFRDVDMPIDEVRQVLQATDDAERQHVIVEHLDRLRRQLEQTQLSVASLQALLADHRPVRADVELRAVPARPVLSRRRVIPFDDESGWLADALAALRGGARAAGIEIDGPDGALFSDELFEVGEGEVVAFVPVAPGTPDAVVLPATNVAVLVHEGPPSELDQAYGALGTIVAERGIGGPGPVCEHYLSATTTEVCWPVTIGTVR